MPLNAAELILARSMESAIRVRPALLFGDQVITYAELHGLVNRAANAFLGLGVVPGDRVPLLLDDGPLYVAAILALMKIGAVVIPLNTKLRPEEYKFIAADSGAKLLVYDSMYAEGVAEVAGVKLLAASGGPDSLTRRVDSASGHAGFAVLDAEDPCFWLYSSGTTGMPKGIIHTQRAAAESSKVMREVLRFDETAVVFCTSKLFFAFALDNGLLGVLRIGAATVLNRAWADPQTIAAQVERFQPDAFLTVPTFFRRLLQLGEEKLAPFKAVPYYVTGGERVPDSVALKWQELTGREILPCHGMSETFCNNFCNFPGQVRLGSCGFALAGVEPMLLPRGVRPGDATAKAIVQGEPGVLWVRHPSLAARYNNEEKTAESFAGDWFCTNDQFRVDADGYWFHEGRADELLKVAGQWVKPQEIEDAVLGEHVREAACVVVADADGFERLALYVVPNHEGSVLSLAEEQARAGLPAHSWPKWVRSIDELPRTPTGKVQKFKLRELLQAELFPAAAAVQFAEAQPTDAPLVSEAQPTDAPLVSEAQPTDAPLVSEAQPADAPLASEAQSTDAPPAPAKAPAAS